MRNILIVAVLFLSTTSLLCQPRPHGAGAHQLDWVDLSFPAHFDRFGACFGADSVGKIGCSPGLVPSFGRSGAYGFEQLHLALDYLHFILLWLWLELLCRAGVLPDLFRRAGHLGDSVDHQPNLVEVLSVWPAGVAVAKPDLLEIAANAQNCNFKWRCRAEH